MHTEEIAEQFSTDCNLRYAGQYFDQESGLHYNRFRYYDPESAQYLSSDPIGLLGGLTPQSYVHNPNGWVDPLGLASGTPIVVIGEGQKAVNKAAQALKAAGYNAESMMFPKVQWDSVDLYKGMPDSEFQKAVDWNKQWLKDKINSGYKIADIGTDGRAVPSEFYKAELEAITETNARGKVTKIKKLPDGRSIADLRKSLC